MVHPDRLAWSGLRTGLGPSAVNGWGRLVGPGKSKAIQQTEIGSGLGLGIMAEGVYGVTATKMSVEFAFRKAWRAWPHTRLYPQIEAGPHHDAIYHGIIGRSDRRRMVHFAVWDQEGAFLVPRLVMDGWDLEESLDQHAQNSGIPMDGWLQLARVFLADLKTEEKLLADRDG